MHFAVLSQELVEPLVELAEVAEHERLHLAELLSKVLLAAALRVLSVVAIRARPARQAARRAARAGDLVHLMQLA